MRRVNADLANDLGNLLHRTLPMIGRYRDGVIPAAVPEPKFAIPLAERAADVIDNFNQYMTDLNPRGALTEIWRLLSVANKFIDDSQPWNLYKEKRDAELNEVLWGLAETIRLVAVLTAPFMPTTSIKIFDQLGLNTNPEDIPFRDSLVWGGLTGQPKTRPGAPLFPRIELEPPK